VIRRSDREAATKQCSNQQARPSENDEDEEDDEREAEISTHIA